MKKLHLTIVIITGLVILFSAYSLAAINQVYGIEYQWYSRYYGKFTSEHRETLRDRWPLQDYINSQDIDSLQFSIVGSKDDLSLPENKLPSMDKCFYNADFYKYVYVYCSFGEVSNPEYRVKFLDIAQRGSIVEIKTSINIPEKLGNTFNQVNTFHPADVIRIERDAFPINGGLYFIFKNQNGVQIAKKFYNLK